MCLVLLQCGISFYCCVKFYSLLQIKKFPGFNRAATLILEKAHFPKRTISANWYSGGHETWISIVNFIQNDFDTIESSAFLSNAFKTLIEIKFENHESIRCLGGWTIGLKLQRLTFSNSLLTDINYEFFGAGFSSHIKLYNSISDTTNIVDIFGVGHHREIVTIHIEKTLAIKRINAYDFSSVFLLQQLYLPACGIEAITENAFVYMINLKEIDLSGNHLKTLPSGLFNVLLENRYFVAVQFNNNMWECQCDLIYVRDALQEYGINFRDFPVNCSLPGDANTGKSVCKINTDKLHESNCRSQYGFNSIFVRFPKFKLYVDEHMHFLTISPVSLVQHTTFYSLHIDQGQPKFDCRLEKPPDCHIFSNRNITLPINNLNDQFGDLFCVVDSRNRTNIWPLNCITLCKNCDIKIWLRIPSLIVFIVCVITVGILAIVLGMSLGYLLVRLKPQILNGALRVVVLRTKERRDSFTIFIMPSNWIENTKR